MTDLIGNGIPVLVASHSTAKTHTEAGKVRACHRRVELPLPGGSALAVADCPAKFPDRPVPRLCATPHLDQHRRVLLGALRLAPA